ncbi:sulfonate transport system ATP-binding protein [Parapusillimonas granuli]|uniref:ABC transporter ATP-binding protein n=1 Tax=Parapusillimonas granuli TaxID=380911 RepID=A0A853G421_9BURK|nr:ABC transporter ATP-binding protein [Parapusillimonas granuli]MBB5215573.1 sulfonate transport system ATP-binding protein [Parapusillimonas granuli]MEB2401072.1 ABC transporter ATP-binding protein [Alcaligenaceae bacterium]NYT49760.1 ABC transporter ATP-binding protein [Parapusillimonas granuli]
MASNSGLAAADAPIAVSVRNLTRRFGEQTVLDAVDLDIHAGEFVALLGRSGCGKSTLLRAVARLDAAASGGGALSVSGQSSVLFQDSRILPWMTVLDNVRLGTPDDMDAGRARRALAGVGLSGKESAWPKVLSGGEQQRVALARALMRNPALILADEPFSALDALTRMRMQSLLLEVHARHRPAVLFVTHDVDEALVLANRIIVLDAGRIHYDRRNPLKLSQGRGSSGFEAMRREILALLGVRVAAAADPITTTH